MRIIVFNFFAVFTVLYFFHTYQVNEFLEKFEPLEESVQHFAKYNISKKELNAIGWHGWPAKNSSFFNFAEDKEPGVIRIGCFGDSHTYGDEVGPENDYPSILQKILNKGTSNVRYEVLNFGSPASSFAQAYSTAKAFVEMFDIDIILLGPKGLHYDRMNTFAPFLRESMALVDRFVLVGGKLEQVSISGKSEIEKIKKYLSFFPNSERIFYDIRPFGIFWSLKQLFGFPKKNFFYHQWDFKTEINQIQEKMAKDLFAFGHPIFHISSQNLPNTLFSKIKNSKYHFRTADRLFWTFPFRAPKTHGSSFANLRVAKFFADLLTGKKFANLQKFEFVQVSSDSQLDLQNFSQLRAFLNGAPIGKLYPIINHAKSSKASSLDDSYDKILVGIHGKGMNRADSVFFPLPHSDKIEFKPKSGKISSFGRIYFIEFDGMDIDPYRPAFIFRDKKVRSILVNGVKLASVKFSQGMFTPDVDEFYRFGVSGDVEAPFDFFDQIHEISIGVAQE